MTDGKMYKRKSNIVLLKNWLGVPVNSLRLKMQSLKVANADFKTSSMPNTNSLIRIEEKNWRRYFALYLKGQGMEIGALHRPIEIFNDAEVTYLDRCSLEELRRHYPELEDSKIIEPDIIDDGELLSAVPDSSYDFLIAAHLLEHLRNPIGALENWCRVTCAGGLIYLVVPDKRLTFDKNRSRTSLEHLILDYLRPSQERDLEHYLDFLIHTETESAYRKRKNFQLSLIKRAEEFAFKNKSIHFHVFCPEDVANLLEWFSANIQKIEIIEGPCMSPKDDEFHFLIKKL
jgi:SAM-dependent methyltransferase